MSQTQYDAALNSAAWAGLFAESDWNNSPFCTHLQGVTGTMTGLIDDTGTALPITVAYNGTNWWNAYSSTSSLTPSQLMMDGYMDNNGGTDSITLQNLPAGTYQVIVYLSGQVAGHAGAVQCAGGTNATYSGPAIYYYSIPAPTAAGTDPTWVRAVSTSSSSPTASSNYIEYDNIVVSAAGGSVTLTQTLLNINNHSGIAGVQILGSFDLTKGLSNAITNHLAYYRIPTGTYQMMGSPSPAYLSFPKASDLLVDGTGVTLIGTHLDRMIDLAGANNVTIQGLTIDYSVFAFTQGVISSIASDNNSVTVTLDAGYPQLTSGRVNFYKAATLFWSPTAPILYTATSTFTDATHTQVQINSSGVGTTVSVGDLVSMPMGNPPNNTICLSNCGNCTLQNIVIYGSPGLGVHDQNATAANLYKDIAITPGPVPAGATAPRLLSTCYDAFGFNGARVGPTVETCTITSAGDDTWSVSGGGYKVVSVTGTTAVISAFDATASLLQVGDTLLGKASSWTITAVQGTATNMTVVLSSGTGPAFAAGDTLVCPNTQGNGFQFLNNTVHSSGRILPKCGGLIQGNLVYGGVFGGVTASRETGPGVFTYVNGLQINQNYFYETSASPGNPSTYQIGCVGLTVDPTSSQYPPPNTCFLNCSITNNFFDTITGCNIALIGNSGTTVSGNVFINPFLTPKNSNGNYLDINWNDLVELYYTQGVSFSNNSVYSPGPYLVHAVSYDIGNDKSGSYALGAIAGFTLMSGPAPSFQQPALP